MKTTPCRLSATAYSKYSQLPSISETVPPSATWGHAMPWWQGPTHTTVVIHQSYWSKRTSFTTQPSTLGTSFVKVVNNIICLLFQNSLLWQRIKCTNSLSGLKRQVIHPSTWWNTYDKQSISSHVESLKSSGSRVMQTTPRSSSGSGKEIDLFIVAVSGVRWK